MKLTPEALYLRLQQCIKEMPKLTIKGVTPEMARWLGEAAILIEEVGDLADEAAFRGEAARIGNGGLSSTSGLSVILYRALARAASNAPAASPGGFIAAGKPFDAFVSIAGLLSEVRSDVLVIDPYADGDLLTKFLVAIPEGAQARVLAEVGKMKPTLKPAAEAWKSQFGVARPIEVRAALRGTLHDRLILIDKESVWLLGQSFNALATRSNTYLSEADAELATMKIVAYDEIWKSASPL